jgi:hypothetical protein
MFWMQIHSPAVPSFSSQTFTSDLRRQTLPIQYLNIYVLIRRTKEKILNLKTAILDLQQ